MEKIQSIQTAKKKACTLWFVTALLVAWALWVPTVVHAAGNDKVTMSTDYPGISLKPGDSANFPLYLINTDDMELDAKLTAEALPEGWEGYFRGSDSHVSQVHVSAGQTKEESPELSYALTIPEDAEEGEYQVVLKADGGTGNTAALPLAIQVTKEEAGSGNFTAEYPEQQGATGTSFSFDTTLVNNGISSQSYSLSAKAPEGWQVNFTPSGETNQVASLPVDAGSSQGITVAAIPGEQVEQGAYTIDCTAVSASETLKLQLQVTITGTYDAVLTTPTGNLSLDAYAGEESPVTLSIQNTGNVALENLQLTSSASTDWNVRFDETTVDTLEAGATKEITAYIQPAENAVIGDYVTAITVSNDQVSQEMDLRVSVKNHTTWGLAAVGIIAVLCVGLGMIIRKYGRR